MADLRFLTCGEEGLLVETADLEGALGLFAALRSAPPEGLTDLVPAARSLLIRFDPRLTSRRILQTQVAALDWAAQAPAPGAIVEIPTTYDGEDLEGAAALLGWSVEELIQRHQAALWTAAFIGFAPGFAYLTCDDPGFDLPRLPSPRVKVPAGSVALAGRFGGIYPSESPGGWRLIGRADARLWDAAREPPALLRPGDRVKFQAAKSLARPPAPAPKPAASAEGLEILRADRPALLQDLGRPGRADQGVSTSGALDREALRAANRMLGNAPGAAALEIAYGGFALRADRPVVLAVMGAPCPVTLRRPEGRESPLPFGRPFALDAGDEVGLGAPPEGARAYLACRGGFAAERALGSAATDLLAKLGPAPLQAGARILPAEAPAWAVDPDPPAPRRLPRSGELVVLEALPGPRADWFSPEALALLTAQDWLVTPESSRIGARLSGERPILRRDQAELPSEGVVAGAIQIPAAGWPVLFLADHPLTGGYPVIAALTRRSLDCAGQIPIGARIRFRLIPPQEA